MEVNRDYLNILHSLLDKYREIFISLFSINDDELDEHLLNYLWHYNYIVLMKDVNDADIFLGTSHAYGGYDRHGYVQSGIARYPEQMYSTDRITFDKNNSVTIYGNRNKTSMQARLIDLITEMASIYFAEQNNLRLSMVKAMITATQQNKTTLEQVFNNTFLNPKSVIVVKGEQLSQDLQFEKVDLNVDYIAEKYQSSIMFYHNQILERLGVNFTPYEKKERLITNEVDSNNEVTLNIKSKYALFLQRRFNKYNKIYGTALTIEANDKPDEEIDESEEEEDDENNCSKNIN